MKTNFDVIITNAVLAEAVSAASEEAVRAYQAGGKGMTIAAIVRQRDGSLRIHGRFIPNDKAVRINAIMGEVE